MTDFVLPTQSSFDALTTSGYTMTDSDAGFLTKEVGGVIKLLIDQMASSELVHIRAVRTSTGKTEKFIIDNIADWSAGPKVVTSDHFANTLLDCTNFFTYTGNDAKIFKNTLPTPVIGTNDDGDPISLTISIAGQDDIVTDLTTAPAARSRAQIAGFSYGWTKDTMVNSSATALGLEADAFSPELVIIMPNPIATAFPVYDSLAVVNDISSAFNSLPVNGVMMINHIEYSHINDAVHLVMESHTSVGHTYEQTSVSSEEGEVVDVICIKRLS